jgi:hypothetical protein
MTAIWPRPADRQKPTGFTPPPSDGEHRVARGRSVGTQGDEVGPYIVNGVRFTAPIIS